jgi:ABC-type dipeptide/oligopeptide/nickel transport system permease component
MAAYCWRRLLLSVPTLLLVSLAVFAAVRAIPGNPLEVLAGPSASADALAAVRTRLGLDRPLPMQYLFWASALLRGDWGTSFVTQTPLAQLVPSRFKNTIALAFCGLVVAALIGIPAGVAAARRRGTLWDLALMTVANAGAAMPAFWFGLLLVVAFAIRLRWFPVEGMGSPLAFVLPSITIGVEAAAVIARLTRNAMVEQLYADYVRTAHAKGLADRVVVYRHAFRNVLIGVTTILGLQIGYLLGGAVFTETIFVWPGVGRLMVDGVLQRDYPLVQMGVLVVATSFILVNIAVDVLYAYLDPRVRYS